MSDRLILATTNPAKADRLRWVFDSLDLVLEPLTVDGEAAPEETGRDFRENAELKARYWSGRRGGLAAASDGGLSIPALGPRWEALRTARAAGPGSDDLARAQHLLELAKFLTGDDRAAFWSEGLALAHDGDLLASWTSTGTRAVLVESLDQVSLRPGFWAASLCLVPELGRTLAQLGDEQLAEADPTWSGLRQQVRAWFASRG